METVDYGQQGWNAIVTANMERLNTYLQDLWGPTQADHDLGSQAVADDVTTQADPAAATAESLTDSSGGTASQTIVAISGSGADANINNNFASLVDEVNKLKADNDALHTALVGTIDYCDALKAKINELLGKLRKTGGCGVLND